jgi:prephenate dehydrogenase
MPQSRRASRADDHAPALTGIAAVRGAVPVPTNTAAAIREATARLLLALVERNRLEPSQIVSALFTATRDLDADFPAHAARRLGWTDVPLLNAREIPVPGAMPRIVRVLITVAGVTPGTRLTPVYLDGAATLRPDLAGATKRRAGVAASRNGNRNAGTRGRGGRTTAGRTPTASRARDRAVRRVALIGLGQIGGSLGLALGRVAGWHRVGYDRDPGGAAVALGARAVDELAPSLAAACAAAEIAVIATPVDTLPALIEAAAAALPPGATLLDTGGARAGVTSALARAAARGVRAVGGHPLAGNEGHGFGAASAALFDGTPFALLPADGAIPKPALDLVRAVGARALRVAPRDHDRALARTSHLPYLLSRGLATLGARAAARGLSGPGFRGMTRLAAGDPRVADATCRANAGEIAAAWRELRRLVDGSVSALPRGPAGRAAADARVRSRRPSSPRPGRRRSPPEAGGGGRP